MSSHVQSLVIGAGAVGLSIARLLTRAGHEVLLLDRASRVATSTSSRNSGVIHAGLYYERGSLKAPTCIDGNWMLRRFCDLYKVPINKCGKLVVAKDKVEDAQLQRIYMRAMGLGARDLVLLDGGDARKFEPELSSNIIGAIWSPHTAVLDQVSFCEALLEDCRSEGKDSFMFSPRTEVVGITRSPSGVFNLTLNDGTVVTCDKLINASGLHARDTTQLLGGVYLRDQPPELSFVKGSYFTLKPGSSPFQRLIYPTRVSGHLGIHTTLSAIDGTCRVGPDYERLEGLERMPADGSKAYSDLMDVSPEKAEIFRNALSDYWESVPPLSAFVPDFAGIRAHTPSKDFVISQHGLPNYVALYGIDSPGLTASLALAQRVGDRLGVIGVTTPEMKSEHVNEWSL
jgi:L-2-hydroxyglutarate oxidase LhgO